MSSYKAFQVSSWALFQFFEILGWEGAVSDFIKYYGEMLENT